MQCALSPHQKLCFKNNFRCLFQFKIKDKYDRKMLNRLKKTFEKELHK